MKRQMTPRRKQYHSDHPGAQSDMKLRFCARRSASSCSTSPESIPQYPMRLRFQTLTVEARLYC